MLHTRMIAHGAVQGVGFRAFACRIGQSLSLVGYAKNLDDGTVEILAEGDERQIDEFSRRLKIRLPYGIHVEKLETVEKKEIKAKSFASFSPAY
mgnify:FL=1